MHFETQIEGSRVENLAGSLGFTNSFAVNSSGRSGGLGVFWNDEIKLVVDGYSKYHINVFIDDLAHVKSRVTFVYGEAQTSERYKTWDMLRGIAGMSNDPWIVIGDFNEVLHAHEHDGIGQRSQAQMDVFRDAIDTCGLSDIGYKGQSWTFEKRVVGGTYARVRFDSGVANPAWVLAFPDASLEHLTAATSDHVPMMLRLQAMHACRRGPRPFKYEVCWERNPMPETVVHAGWN